MSEAQPVVAESLSALLDALRGCLHLAEGRLVIDGEQALRATGAATLAWTTTTSSRSISSRSSFFLLGVRPPPATS
jgi:hypothetical protein